jgi:hypothetical protein
LAAAYTACMRELKNLIAALVVCILLVITKIHLPSSAVCRVEYKAVKSLELQIFDRRHVWVLPWVPWFPRWVRSGCIMAA